MFLFNDSNQNYYEQMDSLDPPVQHEIMGKFVWITYEKQLNENEILYFAPRSVKIDGEIYLNDYSKYYIYTIDPNVFQFFRYRDVSTEDLELIFD